MKMTDKYKSESPEFVLAANIDTQEAVISGSLAEIEKLQKRIAHAQEKKEQFLSALTVMEKRDVK